MNNDKIDRRIVEMSFENDEFEEGISKSKNSLQQFSKALKNSDIGGGFVGLDKSISFMARSFSVFEQIAVGGLRRIGESAITAGAQLVKSLTIGQVSSGFTEYEMKMNTIRAIMNSTGEAAIDVREKLKTLDDYADKTIFSTKDMFDNLATFTNAGIPLEKATKAMIGIANATAYAGQDANAAMYAYRNFSDAISNGFMSLTDWRSISRIAKIGTVELRKEILKTAVEYGTLSQAQIDSGEVTTNFEDTLQKQWMTAEVVTAVLNKYGDATTEVGAKAWKAAQEVRTFSGMMESLKASIGTQFANMSELIFGDLEEAKRNFTFLNTIMTTVFTSGVKSANDMIAGVKELGGIENVFEGLKNVVLSLLSIIKPIAKAFDSIFPPKTKQQLALLTKIFKDFTESLIIADSTGDKIRRTFAGVFAVIDIGWQLVKFLGSAVFELVKVFIPLGDGILDSSASLGDLLVNINKAIKSSMLFQYAILTVKAVATLLREQLSKTIEIVKEFITGLWNAEDPIEYLENAGKQVFSGFIAGIKMVVFWLSDKLTKAVKGVTKFFNTNFDESVGIWPTILEVLKEVIAFISEKATTGFKSFGEAINGLNFNKIATFVVGGVILMFIKQLSDLTGAMTGFTNSLSGVVKGFSKKFFTPSQAGTIHEIAITIGVLAASIWLLSKIPSTELEKALWGLARAIGIFVIAYALIQGIAIASNNLSNKKEQIHTAFGLVGIAAALLAMAVGIQIISKINKDDVWNCVGVLGALLTMITGYQALSTLISKIPGQQKVNTNLLAMSISVSLLIGSLALLKFMTRTEMEASLGKLATIMLVITGLEGIFALTARVGKGNKLSAGILQMAIGITAMIATMKLLTLIDQGTIKQGLTNLAYITLIIAGVELVMGLVGRVSGGSKVQSKILSMSIGMLAMIGLVAIVGNKKYMTSEVLDQGITNLAKIAGIIVGIQLMTALSARIAGGNKVQKILGSVSFTLLAFTGIIAILGTLTEPTIEQGISTLKRLIGLVSSIQLMTVLASKIGGGTRMFGSLIGITVAIATLTGALILLTIPDQDDLRNAVISLTIASAAILAISIAVQKILPAIGAAAKGSNSLRSNAVKITSSLLTFGAVLFATGAFFTVLGVMLPTIKQIGPKDLTVFLIGMTAVTALLASFDYLGKQMTDTQFGELYTNLKYGFIAMVGIILATGGLFFTLGIVLPIIKYVTPQDFAMFIIAMGALTGLLFATNFLGKQMTDGQFDKQLHGFKAGFRALTGILLATMVLFGGMGLVFSVVKNVTPENFAMFLVGMGAMTGLLAIVNVVGKQMTDLQLDKQLHGFKAGFTALTGILLATMVLFGGMGLVFSIVKNVTPENFAMFLGAMIGVTAIVAGIAVLGKAFEVLGKGGLAALEGIGIAIAAVIAIVGITTIMAIALDTIIGESDSLTKGLDLLIEIGAGIGRFVGSIIGGVGAGVLEGIGIGIANFAKSLDGISFSPEALQGIKDLAAAVFVITAASLLDGLVRLNNFGTSSMELFGNQLSGLVKALNKISVDDADKASLTLAAMTPMANNLKGFAEAAKMIPPSGGFIQDFFGDKDIGEFGRDLADLVDAFGISSVLQANHSSDVLTAMKPMIENLKLFANAAQGIPNSDGTLAKWIGDNQIDEFGRDLVRMVAAFASISIRFTVYASEVLQAMTPMIQNIKDFAETARGIPDSGGEWAKFWGDNTVDGFSTQLTNVIELFAGLNAENIKLAVINLATMNTWMLPNLIAFSNFAGTLTAFDNFSLSVFSDDLAAFVNKLRNVDFTVVAPAVAAMGLITESFQTLGADVLENARLSFKNNKEPFQTLIASILSEPTEKIVDQKKILVGKITSVFAAVVDNSAGYVKSFRNLGENMVNGLIDGLERRRPTAVTITKNVIGAVIFEAYKTAESKSPSKVFERLGEYFTLGLAQGIEGETDAAVKASSDMARAADEAVRNTLGIHSNADTQIENGKYAGGGLIEGIETVYGKVKTAFDKVATTALTATADTLQNGMPAIQEKLQQLGVPVNQLTSMFSAEAAGGIGGFLGKVEDTIKGTTDVIKAATDGGTDAGNAYGSGLAGGITGSTKIVKTALDKLKEVFQDKEFYGTINVSEELKMLQDLRKKTKASSDEKKQIDKEIYTRLKTINAAQTSYIDGTKKAQKDALKEKEALDTGYKADVNAELEAAEKEREQTRKEYADKQTAINEKLISDIDAQNKAYESAVKSRASAIVNSYSLFAKIEPPKEKVSGFSLLKNLHDQNDELTKWKQSLKLLEDRGVGTALIEELQAMGPSANAELRGLLSLTDEQLTEYVGLFDRKYSFATKKAEEELVGLKTTTSTEIQRLNTQAATDLEGLKTVFDSTITEINENTLTKLGELETKYDESLDKINTTLTTNLTTIKNQFETTMKTVNGLTETELLAMVATNDKNLKQLNIDTTKRLGELEKTFDTSATSIMSSWSSNLKKIIPNTISTFNDLMPSLKTAFNTAGTNATSGFVQGMRDKNGIVITEAQYLANTAIKTTETTLQVKSPSKVFEGIGQFVSMGFANGITNYAQQAEKATEEMARGPIAAVSEALANMEESNDLSFTITPIVDLSAVRSTNLSKLLSTPVTLGAASGKMAAETIQNGSRIAQPSVATPETTTNNNTNSPNIVMNNNFSVRNDSDIRKISQSLGTLIDRYNNAKGVAVV